MRLILLMTLQKQFQELKALSEEPADKDAMSVDDFKKATQQWRTK